MDSIRVVGNPRCIIYGEPGSKCPVVRLFSESLFTNEMSRNEKMLKANLLIFLLKLLRVEGKEGR